MMNSDLRLALELADAADAITVRHFQSATLAVRTKIDLSPVSEADEAVERALRERLAAERPDDGVAGEEFGTSGSGARRWVIDPIDATANYVRGIPVYGTLIALVENGVPMVGVIAAPAMSRRWWASRGDGAFCNGRPMHVSRIDAIGNAHIAYSSVKDWERYNLGEPFLALMRRCTRARGFGDFWMHMLVAEGAIEIAVEPVVAAWDVAAVQIIVEEAGGRFTDLKGDARFDGGNALSTNGLLHDTVLEALR
ncbi:MAG TPA: histidinol-phosphatase [Thermoanaerobaculia bacterium]|nr:histidinol-phosphatase [Thermoanaerobaculia bacterium]